MSQEKAVNHGEHNEHNELHVFKAHQLGELRKDSKPSIFVVPVVPQGYLSPRPRSLRGMFVVVNCLSLPFVST